MRIDGPPPPPIRPTLLATLAAAVTAKAFANDASGGPASPAPPAPTLSPLVGQATTSVAMLVALASIDPASEKRRRQAVDADRGLTLLEQLRDELAAGLATPAQMQALGAWVETLEPPADPTLAAISREIELRVRVELAKHERMA